MPSFRSQVLGAGFIALTIAAPIGAHAQDKRGAAMSSKGEAISVPRDPARTSVAPGTAAASPSSRELIPGAPSYDALAAFLAARLRRIALEGGGTTMGFDYEGLVSEEREHPRIESIRIELLRVDPHRMSESERLAWGINTYNLLVVEQIVQHLATAGAVNPAASVQDFKDATGGFFDRPVVRVTDHTYSLTQFERAFVFGGWDPASDAVRPRRFDPRAHFALMNGTRGGPPLSRQPYEARTLEAQLDRAARLALASPRHLVWDAASNSVSASALFEWYARDFGGPEAAFQFLLEHAPAATAAAIRAGGAHVIAKTIEWDWRLNTETTSAAAK